MVSEETRPKSEIIARFKNALVKWGIEELRNNLVVSDTDGTTVVSVSMETLMISDEQTFVEGLAKIAGYLGKKYGR